MDTAAVLIVSAFCGLTLLLIVVMVSQPKRHERHAATDLGKVLAIRCGYCGDLCVRPLRGQPGLCEVCDTPLAGMPWTIEDRTLLIERLTGEVIEGDYD